MNEGHNIDEIIAKAEKKNKTLKVGGALWFDPETNKVHQILEGEEFQVTALLDVIITDARHRAIVMEDMEMVDVRKFQEWGGMKLSESPLLKDCNHNANEPGFQREEKKEDA
eukprot:CAMPEP_0185276942 /NCGR_PEP_ID=MMETSP1359-20130426/57439_1 /TAXON_ID=552665 /ORGANISM="Bigelowiella longifila, Strain CCMP242" /LENGTH=111 /DNA_ID=CAMNT_0027870841 /DNA_START=56 /DNA_END=391 /DNA_ORIENTATION=+